MMYDWLLKRFSNPATSVNDGVVYKLENYTCDGTSATALDTGIKLFDTTAFPKGFIIEMTATSSTFASQVSFLRCRATNSPYNGCCIRWSTSSGTMQMQMNGDSKTKGSLLGATVDYVIGYYPGAMGFWGINGDVSSFGAKTISTNDTLCIGGEKDANGNWKSGRYATVTIHSVKVIDLAALIDDNDYPYFEALEANSTVGMTLTGTAAPTLYYSTDKSNWALWDYTDIALSNLGDRVYFYGTSSAFKVTNTSDYARFTGSGSLKLGGNIARFVGNAVLSIGVDALKGAFMGLTALVSAGDANFGVVKYIEKYALENTFKGCTALTSIPKINFISSGSDSLSSMFQDCTSLTAISDIDVLHIGGSRSFQKMFYGCTSLVSANMVCRTSATGDDIYKEMFRGCTSLVNPPAIVGTTLSNNYRFSLMFCDCTSLERAPDLLPATLSHTCYYNMFKGCTSLKYVKCLATDISASSCTDGWLNNVAATGTFVKAASMNDWSSGGNGIPSGWTVVDDTE